MKKQTKIWLLVASFALLFALIFVVGAFAADEAPELDPTSPLYTPYGMIDEEYASVEDYPFVAFDSKGNCLGGSKVFAKDDEKVDPAIAYYVQKKDQNDVYYIYLRTDYTQTESSYNLQFINSTVIVDLGGHTFNYQKTISAQMKMKGYNPRITFKNGYIHALANVTMFSTNTVDASTTNRASQLHITFENITFSVYSKFSSKNWVTYTDGSKNDPNVGAGGYAHSVTMKNCVFDLSNITAPVNIATIGQKTGQIAETINFIGVHFEGDPSNVNLVNKSYDLSCTVTFGANEKGDILTNTRPTSTSAENIRAEVNGVAMALYQVVSTDGDNTTYTLGTHERLTPYGWIPTDVYKNEDYTLLLFHISTGEIVWKGDRWGGEGTEGGALSNLDSYDGKGSHAIYFQGDHIDTPNSAGRTPAYYNFGCITGSHIIDFNGYTLTSTSDNIFHNQAKNKNTTSKASFVVKNGTINLGQKYLIMSGSISREVECTMQSDFVFENMNFINIKASGGLVSDDSFGNFKTVTNITMINCNIEVNGTHNSPLFSVLSNRKGTANVTLSDGTTVTVETASLNHSFHIVLEGGKITSNVQQLVAIFPTEHTEGRTMTFKQGDNGYTEIYTAKMTGYSDYLARTVENGVRYFILDESTDTQSIYRLGIKNQYGYIASHFLDAEKYPILVFKKDVGYAAAGFDHLGGEGDNAGVWSYVHRLWGATDTTIYLQADLKGTQTNVYYNWGATTGTHLFDLNGHTITLNDNFCQAQFKTTGNLNYTFINGTIKVGYKNLVAIGTGESASTSSEGKVTNILFENINFNIANGYLVYDMGKGLFHSTTNVEFKNCHFEITNAQTKALCYFGNNTANSPLYDIHVTFTGGSMNYQGANVAGHFDNKNNIAGHTVSYQPLNGMYTTVTTLTSVDGASRVFYNANNGGISGLRKLQNNTNGTTKYELVPFGFVSAYLNLTNDLNLVYRTYVPTRLINPSVTFTVGNSTVTVDTYTVDENGYYCFRLPNINPARMGETVSASISATFNANNKVYTATHNTLSVKTYVEAIKAMEEEKGEEKNVALCELVDALLVYGASAQQYLGQSADTFVTEIGELSDISSEEYTLKMTGEVSDKGAIGYFGMNLDGAFAIRLGIVANVEGLTLTATQGDKVVTYNLDEYTANGGIITIVYDGIMADDLDEDVTFTLTLGEEVVGKTLTVNANSYLYRTSIGNDVNLATLAKALYAYGVCAKNYVA